jgi:hypothetical protein
MIALEVDDMQETADYLSTRGVDIVWGPRVRETYSRAEFCTPTGTASSSGNGSSEQMLHKGAGPFSVAARSIRPMSGSATEDTVPRSTRDKG